MPLVAEKTTTRVEVLNRNGKVIAMGVINEHGSVVSHMFAQQVTDKEREAWFHYVSASRLGQQVETTLTIHPLSELQ